MFCKVGGGVNVQDIIENNVLCNKYNAHTSNIQITGDNHWEYSYTLGQTGISAHKYVLVITCKL